MIAVAIPAASLCINRRLYHIATANTVIHTKRQKRRAIMVDLAIGIGLPVLEGILRMYTLSCFACRLLTSRIEYIPQGHRYDIYEDVGCFPWIYNTPMAFVFVYSWPLVICIISAVYCCMLFLSDLLFYVA